MRHRWVSSIAAVVAALGASTAWAGHGSWGSSGGSWGGSSGGSSGGWYSSGGSWGSSGGSSGGWLVRHHHRRWHCHRVRRYYYGSSGGSSGGWYSSGGSWGSSGGSWGSSGGASIGSAYRVMPSQPKAAPAKPAPAKPAPAGEKSTSTATGSAVLSVSVPADAKVFVNDRLTRTPGTVRTYISRGLVPGVDYTYAIRVERMRDGQKQVESKVITLRAGSREQIAFNFDAVKRPETILTLHVPEQATVYLAGSQMKARGAVRRFRTRQLKPGEKWNDYTVRVELERDGKKVVKEAKVTLEAGQSKEVSFDFNDDRLALAK